MLFLIHDYKLNNYLVSELDKSKERYGKGRENITETKPGYSAIKPVFINDVSACKETCVFKISIPEKPT